MGVTNSNSAFLLDAFAAGRRFERILTLGRQSLFVSPVILERQMRRRNCWPPELSRDKFYNGLCQYPYYLDRLLVLLGAKEVSSVDFSDYEGANILHDLNQPIPKELEGRFDLVYDGGALEHIFNIPVALKNMMEMVEPGGCLIANVVANNYFGHGFYQLSPEFFFRTLTEVNGFQLERMILVEYDLAPLSVLGQNILVDTRASWYEVKDPAVLRKRVLLSNRLPVGLMVQARRLRRTPIFMTPPQQSDYVTVWDNHTESGTEGSRSASRRLRSWVKQNVSPKLLLHIGYYWLPRLFRSLRPFGYSRVTRQQSLRNKELYRRIK